MNLGYWAKGKTLFDAVKKFAEHDAASDEMLVCSVVIGDDNASLIDPFTVERAKGSIQVVVGKAQWKHWNKQRELSA